ncbi:MAG: peptidase domain-containing ABC transporter [Tannerella sp.]|jgi:ATP-binding cassette subfamily B protein|nr:peptidase domain-containing ABC transporter [Tannerella sp.]
MQKSFPHFRQLDAMDCGPTCLRMIAKYYGRNYTLQSLRERSFITREGVSMLGISEAAESIGFRTTGVKITLEQLKKEVPLPCILHWNQNHFVVLYKIKKASRSWLKQIFNKSKNHSQFSILHSQFCIADPASTLVTFTEEEFKKCWLSTRTETHSDDSNSTPANSPFSILNSQLKDAGTALLLEPGPDFYEMADEKQTRKQGLSFFFRYLNPFKKELLQLILGMITASILQLIMPFLTQSLVDTGIRDSNLNFITLILIAQLMVFLARMATDFIRSWILLHVNTRINIALISDFLAKLMRLPLKFFDTKMVGDIMQRIGDHRRIETFLTGSSINTLFSFVNFIVFGIVLAYYNLAILGLFLLGNGLYVAWILAFMKYRRELDIRRFSQAAGEQSNLFQLITGMQEIKLNNCETEKRWQWERIQVKLFKISIKGLALEQYQQIGSAFFSQSTNIFISFLAARAVVTGDMTLGMMMSLTYIIGQLTSPVEQFIGFARAFQDAKISLERLSEIHQKEDEEQTVSLKLSVLPDNRSLTIDNLSFSYDGADRDYVLENISLTIPERRVTAIVGASGSGKTTLVKLLLGFYTPNKGEIRIGEGGGTNARTHEGAKAERHEGIALQHINPHVWRACTGSVMQDGFIFSDTIAKNIAIGDEIIDRERLLHAVKVANIREFIDSLPLGYNTKIGMEGSGISQGQRQRILIARAVYKNPEFIFLDEATNALDANNERLIMEQLHHFYQGKTVVVVAHRLSTVRDADRIVVLDKGRIAEEGTHAELTAKRGIYYELVKNQLELGN